MSSAALLRAYKQDTEKKSLMIRKAEVARNKLVFVAQALRTLFADEHFVTLLRAEGLETLPHNLSRTYARMKNLAQCSRAVKDQPVSMGFEQAAAASP